MVGSMEGLVGPGLALTKELTREEAQRGLVEEGSWRTLDTPDSISSMLLECV